LGDVSGSGYCLRRTITANWRNLAKIIGTFESGSTTITVADMDIDNLTELTVFSKSVNKTIFIAKTGGAKITKFIREFPTTFTRISKEPLRKCDHR